MTRGASKNAKSIWNICYKNISLNQNKFSGSQFLNKFFGRNCKRNYRFILFTNAYFLSRVLYFFLQDVPSLKAVFIYSSEGGLYNRMWRKIRRTDLTTRIRAVIFDFVEVLLQVQRCVTVKTSPRKWYAG